MTIYVGQLYCWHDPPVWPWSMACHMFADEAGELHRFAERIGLKRSWFHKGSSMPHYDLTRSKRKKALAAGAVEADRETEVRYIRRSRTRNLNTAGAADGTGSRQNRV